MTWVARFFAGRRVTTAVPRPTRPSPPYADAIVLGTPPADLQRHLADLRDTCVERVNCAVEQGRPDLVREAVDDYTDESLAAMTAVRLVT